jgi:hypothetical protein
MAESTVQQQEGVGKKVHTWNRTIGANGIEDQFVLAGLQSYATYTASTAVISFAVAADHLCAWMAGSTNNVYLRYLAVYARVAAGTATNGEAILVRLTSAGTGGTAITPAPMDTTDAAAGATAMSLPTAKGTETTMLWRGTIPLPATMAALAAPILELDWRNFDITKSPRIAAGTSNGIALKHVTGVATATGVVYAELVELPY